MNESMIESINESIANIIANDDRINRIFNDQIIALIKMQSMNCTPDAFDYALHDSSPMQFARAIIDANIDDIKCIFDEYYDE